MILNINTTNQKEVVVGLKQNGKVLESLSRKNEYGSQVLLPLIENLLKNHSLWYQDLQRIEVETGPGSFTGLKVGVSVANALGFALGIPVNSKKFEDKLVY